MILYHIYLEIYDICIFIKRCYICSMWVFLALAAAVCFAVVFLLDEYCVDEVFHAPWIGVVTSAIASLIVFAPLPFILPLLNWNLPSLSICLIAILAGILIQISQFLYFYALANTNAGIVATYLNINSAILPVISYFIFGSILTPQQYIGIILLIVASNTMLIADHNLNTRVSALLLTFGVSILQAVSYLVQDYIYSNTSFIIGFSLITFGLTIPGIAAIFFRPVRVAFSYEKVWLPSLIKFFLFIELINLFALAFTQKSIQVSSPSLVSAIETTIPGFTFVFSLMAITLFRIKYDKMTFSNIGKKLSALSLMIVGVYLVS